MILRATPHSWKAHVPPDSPPPVMPPSSEPPPEVIDLPPGEPIQPVREPGQVNPAQAGGVRDDKSRMALRAASPSGIGSPLSRHCTAALKPSAWA